MESMKIMVLVCEREGMVSVTFSCVFVLCLACSSTALSKLLEGLMENKEQIENEISILPSLADWENVRSDQIPFTGAIALKPFLCYWT